MKTAFIVLFILIVLLLTFRSIPKVVNAMGLAGGVLSKCPNKPNCVCSEYKKDANHFIDPIIIPKNSTVDTFSILKNIIQEMGGNVQVESDNYLAATFTSTLFKFTDDLEIRMDSTRKVIHIRSASRVGYSDMGVNKKRSQSLKKLFNNKVAAANKSMQLAP